MDDTAFLAALEDAALDPAMFDHRGHVRAGFLILRAAPSFGSALVRMEAAVRRFASAQGKDGLYHETVTVAFMALINARMKAAPPQDWPTFAAVNADLFDPRILARYYPGDYLARPDTRAAFHLPPVAENSAA